MPLFKGMSLVNNEKLPRTNTHLVVSGGDSPAEHWYVDESLKQLFYYPYGGPGQENVVISKGMMVAATGNTKNDFDTGRQIAEITIADGTLPAIGMVPYNLSLQVDDEFTGNQPAIITREYVELPYFPTANEAYVENCLWGLVHGDVKPGDYLKVSSDYPGKLTKWDSTTGKSHEIVAQVLGIDDQLTANAWLEWAMWDEAAKRADGYPGANFPTPGEDGYSDREAYMRGTQDLPHYLSQYTTEPTGLPRLTDGDRAFVSKTGSITVAANTEVGTKLIFNDTDKRLFDIATETAGFKVANENASSDNGQIIIEVETVPTVDTDVTFTYKARKYGVPAYWNFEGAVGAVRLLLKF